MKKIALLSVLVLLITSVTWAQPGFEDDVDDVPLDGGISILTAGAVVYGIRKRLIKDEKKQDKPLVLEKEY
jgi:hypothetical protein